MNTEETNPSDGKAVVSTAEQAAIAWLAQMCDAHGLRRASLEYNAGEGRWSTVRAVFVGEDCGTSYDSMEHAVQRANANRRDRLAALPNELTLARAKVRELEALVGAEAQAQ